MATQMQAMHQKHMYVSTVYLPTRGGGHTRGLCIACMQLQGAHFSRLYVHTKWNTLVPNTYPPMES